MMILVMPIKTVCCLLADISDHDLCPPGKLWPRICFGIYVCNARLCEQVPAVSKIKVIVSCTARFQCSKSKNN